MPLEAAVSMRRMTTTIIVASNYTDSILYVQDNNLYNYSMCGSVFLNVW